MQLPTLTDVHIRTTEDAHKLFYAVELGKLPKIEKRLDIHERAALRPGNVYVWEEKPPNADNYAVTMERFTEGKAWTPSRVRDDFLMYYEKPAKKKGKGDKDEDGTPRSMEDHIVRDGERDTFVKLTYSAYRSDDATGPSPSSSSIAHSNAHDKDGRKPRKWHLNAYFTKQTEGQLRTIDDIPLLRDLVVPDGLYKTARSTPKNAKKAGDAKDGATERGTGKASGSGTQKERIYAAFPSSHPSTRSAPGYQPYPSGQGIVAYPQPSLDPDIKAVPSTINGTEPSGINLISPQYAAPLTSTNLSGYVPSEAQTAYAQASSGYPNYASYSSHLSSQIPQATGFVPSSTTEHQPLYEELLHDGHNKPGSGHGSSEASPSPMSEYSTISRNQSILQQHYFPHLPELHPEIHQPFPEHPNSAQSHLHLHVNVHAHPQSHTPALSEASHSSSSDSPYSISVPVAMNMRMEVDEEDLSSYVRAPPPPPFVIGHDNPPYDPAHASSPSHPFDTLPDPVENLVQQNVHQRSQSYSSEHGDDRMSESGRSVVSSGSGGSRGTGEDSSRTLAPLQPIHANHVRRSHVDEKVLRMLDPPAI